MEISLEAIISVIGLFIGGSGGAFFTWRYQKRKAAADAKAAEADAEKAKIEATQANTQLIKDIQGSYQQLAEDLKHNLDTQQEYNEEQKQYIQELKEDRKHLRDDRDELRNRLDKCDEDIRVLKRDVARYGRMVECMRPFLCGREGCAIRVPVTISQEGVIEKKEDKFIEPMSVGVGDD